LFIRDLSRNFLYQRYMTAFKQWIELPLGALTRSKGIGLTSGKADLLDDLGSLFIVIIVKSSQQLGLKIRLQQIAARICKQRSLSGIYMKPTKG